ncbi:outer membrane beta-barrel protein [Polaribacter undariae]|uniref:Outer membrane beta-barrel protein n=1 Tax=Polaribacter sejongensis TaxID=985043 RepID=A0AAJ1QXX5_9FLAO|nr:outer membrane beta-barrel protein [Polaribacter undariae]MDN3620152.1 outer membrane beta-barrel protein [Polaribacter undariae]UWD32554.1 outer membrane beta-barrel protein [Polaribacter undariae]
MKQLITAVAAILVSTASFAQFQISASSGYAMSSAGMLTGTTTTTTSTENNYGSYGEGSNFQLRGTYFFNEKFGAEIGVGYLHGADQTINKTSIPGVAEVNAVARARAFGASASMVYNFTNNFYGRIGALIKVGGKTEAVVYNKAFLSEPQYNALGLTSGSYSETNYVEDFHGQFPLGFVAALGYSYDLNEHFALFVEAEYYGISLKRKDSEIAEFNTDIYAADETVAYASVNSLDNLPAGFYEKTTYVDELPHNNTDPSKKLSQKVPYSSFGLNFGVTYKFSGSSKK